jgi:hypothetical protein
VCKDWKISSENELWNKLVINHTKATYWTQTEMKREYFKSMT